MGNRFDITQTTLRSFPKRKREKNEQNQLGNQKRAMQPGTHGRGTISIDITLMVQEVTPDCFL